MGVLADHHICVPLPITRQRGLFCLLVCCGTPSYYGVGAFSLLIPHGMHLVAQLNFSHFGGLSSQQDTSPKRALAGTSK